VNEVEVS